MQDIYLEIDKYAHSVALSFKYVALTSLNFGTSARTKRHRRLYILRLPLRPFAISTFAVARLARRDGSSWKTITYRWLWIFRDSGSALFRSRECYGAEFSTVLFPLRHVTPFFVLSYHVAGERKGRRRKGANAPSPRWSSQPRLSRLFPGIQARQSDWSENTRTKPSGRR